MSRELTEPVTHYRESPLSTHDNPQPVPNVSTLHESEQQIATTDRRSSAGPVQGHSSETSSIQPMRWLWSSEWDTFWMYDPRSDAIIFPNGERRQRPGNAQKRHLIDVTTSSDKNLGYRRQDRDFFRFGRVFFAIYPGPEPDVVTDISDNDRDGYGGPYRKPRAFVVVEAPLRHSYCTALPIEDYGAKGSSRTGMVKGQHAIIYTGRLAPASHDSELSSRDGKSMLPIGIRVSQDNPTDKLPNRMRLNLARRLVFESNALVKPFGCVHPSSMNDLAMAYYVALKGSEATTRTVVKREAPSIAAGKVPDEYELSALDVNPGMRERYAAPTDTAPLNMATILMFNQRSEQEMELPGFLDTGAEADFILEETATEMGLFKQPFWRKLGEDDPSVVVMADGTEYPWTYALELPWRIQDPSSTRKVEYRGLFYVAPKLTDAVIIGEPSSRKHGILIRQVGGGRTGVAAGTSGEESKPRAKVLRLGPIRLGSQTKKEKAKQAQQTEDVAKANDAKLEELREVERQRREAGKQSQSGVTSTPDNP